MASRLVDFEKSARVIIMQRLHVHDLAGAVLKEGGYEHLCLPFVLVPQAISSKFMSQVPDLGRISTTVDGHGGRISIEA